MSNAIDKICVGTDADLETVLETLQESPFGICIVVGNDKQVLGTVTDGDCRRALINRKNLTITAAEIMNKSFVVVDRSFRLPQIYSLMRANQIRQIPVVDDKRMLVDIITSPELVPRKEPRKNPVLILAGGRGQRLRPLTDLTPKPLLPVRGRPMIEHLVRRLVLQGFTDIAISINYLGSKFEEHFGSGEQFGCSISYIREEAELGTAGPLRLLNGSISAPLLVVNGDLVTEVDFGACVDFHYANRADLTLTVSSYEVKIPYGVVSLDAENQVTGVQEKPTLYYSINAGLYVVDPNMLPLVPKARPCGMTEFIDCLVSLNKRVGAFPIHERWLDVGLPENYARAQEP